MVARDANVCVGDKVDTDLVSKYSFLFHSNPISMTNVYFGGLHYRRHFLVFMFIKLVIIATVISTHRIAPV